MSKQRRCLYCAKEYAEGAECPACGAFVCHRCLMFFELDHEPKGNKCPNHGCNAILTFSSGRFRIFGENGEEVAKVARVIMTGGENSPRPAGFFHTLKEQLVSETIRIVFVVSGAVVVA